VNACVRGNNRSGEERASDVITSAALTSCHAAVGSQQNNCIVEATMPDKMYRNETVNGLNLRHSTLETDPTY
jgi:hypothetical protein